MHAIIPHTLTSCLQVETKRSRRALTKWFKLKLKVKVMRSRLRELKENGGRSPFSGPPRSQSQEAPATATVEKTGQALSPLQAWAGKEAEVRKEEAMEEWEPPCKRPKLENHSTSSTVSGHECFFWGGGWRLGDPYYMPKIMNAVGLKLVQ